MPPEDSVEAELFRAKDPAALGELTEWLAAKLKEVK